MLRWFYVMRTGIRSLLARRAFDQQLNADIQFHLEEATAEYRRAGLSPDEARRAALNAFGNPVLVVEDVRQTSMGVSTRIQAFWRDVRYAAHSLRAAPTFAAVTLLSIVLGIGASTALFSIVNGLLLRSLPVANPQQLVKLATANSTEAGAVFSFAVFDGVRRQPGPFDGALAYSCCQRGFMSVAERHEPVDQMLTSDDFFTTLGLHAHLGRLFAPGDDLPTGGAAGSKAVISYALWRRLGGKPEVVGQSVTVDQLPMTVIGVTPPSFLGMEVGRKFDVAIPIHTQALLDPAKPLGDYLEFLKVWLRLRPEASVTAATEALRAAQPAVRAAAMPGRLRSPDWLTDPFALRPEALGTSTLRGQFGKPVLALLASRFCCCSSPAPMLRTCCSPGALHGATKCASGCRSGRRGHRSFGSSRSKARCSPAAAP